MNWLRTFGNKILNFFAMVGQARYERDRMFTKAIQDHKLGR